MDDNYLICPKCSCRFISNGVSGKCQVCNTPAVYTGFTSDEWNDLPLATQNEYIGKIRRKEITAVSEYNGKASYFWINFSNFVSGFAILVGIVLSLTAALASGKNGWLVAIFGIFFTLLSVVTIRLLTGIAKDLRDIRNKNY